MMHGTKHSNGKEILNKIRLRVESFLKGRGCHDKLKIGYVS